MLLTDEQIAKFQAIWKARFGTDISRQTAMEKSVKLVRLMELIYRPITLQDQKDVLTRQEELNNQ